MIGENNELVLSKGTLLKITVPTELLPVCPVCGKPLTDKEKDVCFRVAEIINSQITVPCTACHYCTEGCPMNIAIPEYFSLYNEDMRENLEEKGWTVNFTNYDLLSEKRGKAKDCIACGQCESVCPQHLTIIDFLKDVSAHFDR